MKIYAYDPSTGKRGEILDNVERASWSSSGVQYNIEQGNLKDMGWKSPANSSNINHTMHIDGGISGRDGKPISYQRDDQWIAYCTGEWFIGNRGVWEWVILPSRKDLEAAKIK